MFSRSGFNPTAGCRCRHGSLLHIVCPCLSLAVGQVNWGEVEGKGKERRGEVAGVCIALRCHTLRQHEVSGPPTPSATWDTGGRSHTRSGMWYLECMFHGMSRWRWRHELCTRRHYGGDQIFFSFVVFSGLCAHAVFMAFMLAAET